MTFLTYWWSQSMKVRSRNFPRVLPLYSPGRAYIAVTDIEASVMLSHCLSDIPYTPEHIACFIKLSVVAAHSHNDL